MLRAALLLLACATAFGGASAHRSCAFDDSKMKRSRAAELRADYFADRAARRAKAAAADDHRRYSPDKAGGVITYNIPTYFYILYDGAGNNISYDAVTTNMASLNEDFTMTNADISTLDPDFASIKSPVKLNFVLEGATWHQVAQANYSEGTATADMMADAPPVVPTHLAMHVYVADLSEFGGGGGTLGYAQFPRGDNQTDVIVLNYAAVGVNTPNAAAPSTLGRTLTHEVGHWLGLPHIWGDGDCNAGDNILDTPNANTSHYGCATSPVYSCGEKNMVQNFMDYQDDNCMVAFTKDQATRMRGFLDDPRGWRRSLVVGTTCGDGKVDANEECDDNNTIAEDGCTFCIEDLGYDCNGQPSSCSFFSNLVPLISDVFGNLDSNTGAPVGWQGIQNQNDFEFNNATKEMTINMSAPERARMIISNNITIPADPGAFGVGGAIVMFTLDMATEDSTSDAMCKDFFTFEVIESKDCCQPVACGDPPVQPAIYSDTVPRYDVSGNNYTDGCKRDWTGFCTPATSITDELDGFGSQWNGPPALNYLDNPVRMRYDLSPWAGKTVNFIFYAQTDGTGPSVGVKISNLTIWADRVAIATTGSTTAVATTATTTGAATTATTGAAGTATSASGGTTGSKADDSSTSSEAAPVGAIVGGVIGGLVFIIIIAAIIFLLLKKGGKVMDLSLDEKSSSDSSSDSGSD